MNVSYSRHLTTTCELNSPNRLLNLSIEKEKRINILKEEQIMNKAERASRGPSPDEYRVVTVSKSDNISHMAKGNLYVERSFATLDSLSKEMKDKTKKDQVVLYFLGPSGTGKMTTLEALYFKMVEDNKDENITLHYIDAKTEDVEGLPSCTYVFVDNAQSLFEKLKIISWLWSADALCLAFSPVLIQWSGYSTMQFHIHFTKVYNFRPFSKTELDDYAKKMNVDERVVKQVKDIGVYLPRMIR